MKLTDKMIEEELLEGNVVTRESWQDTCLYIWKNTDWIDAVQYGEGICKGHDLTVEDIMADDWVTTGMTNIEFSRGR